MRLKHGLRFRAMAVGLRSAGHEKIANMIISSWKVGSAKHCIIMTLASVHASVPTLNGRAVCVHSVG